MSKDTVQLLKYGLISVFLIAFWFGLTYLSRNTVVQFLLG